MILGSSGSAGSGLTEGESWAHIVERELAVLLGEAPTVVHTRFYTWTADWEEYLEKTLAKGPFDAVVLSPTKFGFSVYAADNRIRRLLGKRAGDWFKRSADTFDARTSIRTSKGRQGKVNRAVHKAVRRLVGQEPLSDVATITRTYIHTMSRLAQLEDVQVIVISNTAPSTVLARRRPRLAAQVSAFQEALRREAGRRRFAWIERQDLWNSEDGDRDQMYSDGLHSNAEVHRRIAAAVLGLLAPSAAVFEVH